MAVHCLNCNADYEGKYCPECGQKASTHRITFAAILHDIPHSVFHIDKGFFYTFAQLAYRPGKAIGDYLAGKRTKYFSPFTYLLLLCAGGTFVNHQVAHLLHVSFTRVPGMLFPDVAEFFNHYPALMLCVLVPFLSLWSWLFSRDKGYNYWEHFILNIFIVAQFNIFYTFYILSRVFRLYNSANITPMLLCFGGYLALAYVQMLHRKKTSFTGIVKSVLMFILVSLTLITGLTLTGFMTPWWG